MNLKQLSDDELLKSLKELKRNEAKATLSLLYHLIELENRGLFRDAGYSSLFDYCTRYLGYSEGAAGTFLQAQGIRLSTRGPAMSDAQRAESNGCWR